MGSTRRAMFAIPLALCGSLAAAQEDAARAPREVRIIVGSGVAGGYDAYARLAAPFLGKHLPGNPKVVVQNMPGGGGLRLANYMARIAPRDGSEIAITNRNLIAGRLLGLVEAANIQYDPSEFTWLANLTEDTSFLIVRADAGLATIDDLRARDVLLGSTTRADNNGIFPYVANNLLGTRFKVVSGYASSSEMALALDRGEIEGVAAFSWASMQSQRPNWLSDGTVRLLMQLGLKRLPKAADVPLMLEFARSPLDRAALELLATLNTIGRPFFAPPQVAPGVAASLRRAFERLATDEGFLAEARREKQDVSFDPGPELQDTVRRMNGVGPDVAAAARRAMDPNGAVERTAPKR
jgi:tripartite-type tricarboxylate transporter receptor subunit TctC